MTPDNSSDMANPIDEILGVGDGVASVLDLPAAVDPSVYETLVGDQHAPHSQTGAIQVKKANENPNVSNCFQNGDAQEMVPNDVDMAGLQVIYKYYTYANRGYFYCSQ